MTSDVLQVLTMYYDLGNGLLHCLKHGNIIQRKEDIAAVSELRTKECPRLKFLNF